MNIRRRTWVMEWRISKLQNKQRSVSDIWEEMGRKNRRINERAKYLYQLVRDLFLKLKKK
jgi:hypothetical protein